MENLQFERSEAEEEVSNFAATSSSGEVPEEHISGDFLSSNAMQKSESESEVSDPETPDEVDEELEEKAKTKSVKEPKKKKRKKRDPTKRRKIRKLLSENKLQSETLEALRQEEERKKRLEEQALKNLQTFKNEVSEAPISMNLAPNSNSYTSFQPKSGGVNAATTYLSNLLTSKDALPIPAVIPFSFPSASKPPPKAQSEDVICISSDSDDDKAVPPPPAPKSDMIDLSSDSSDDVICTGEVEDEKTGLEDVNNSGMHIEDAKNQRDNQGRVLVNVNRPANEPEIFLAPQLAAAVLPHQIGGIRFMYDNVVETLSHYKTSAGFGCILAHSMGLGKTLQVICFTDVFLRYTEARTVLCVVPVNTLMNWVSEYNMWLPPKSKCLDENPAAVWPRAFSVHILSDNHKTVDSRSKVVSQWYEEGGVLLLGYEMYRQLTSRKQRKRRRKKSPKPNEPIDVEEEDRLTGLAKGMQDSLLKPGPDLIICDEGHRIKNSHASISQMLKNVRTRRRIVLTGYPLQNNLMEYWCMVDFVRPNFLGTKQEFSNMFERPILNGQCADSNESDVKLMRFRSHVLHSLLKGFVQRRSHSVLQKTLQLKEEHVFMIRLSDWQKKLYNSFWEAKMNGSSGSWCSTVNPIKAFSVCCKIWNHPDVLYRTVQERIEDSAEVDPDFDIPESLDGAISTGRKSRQKSPINSQDIFNNTPPTANGDGSAVSSPSEAGGNNPSTPNPTPIIQTPAFGPFGDDRERRMSYDWAKELFPGYQTGVLEMSGKMVVLMELINSSVIIGDRILVFSQSLSTLSLIEDFLSEQFVPSTDPDQPHRKWCKNENYFRLDGNTHSGERDKMINLFNSPSNEHFKLFLLSTRAGCLGINLIGANRVVVFDASWNPCHDAQAVCRVYRYGQQKTCHIYRLVTDQSMEKKIYERQVAKQGMSDRVVDKLNPTQVFTKQDVLSLIVYSKEELPPVDFSTAEEEYGDPVLLQICKVHGKWFTKKPFTHESLLLDCKDQRLTKAEKRLAEKGYEKDKLASSAYNYGRQSYAGFYGSASSRSSSAVGNINSNFPPSTQSHDHNRPIANVRPMQSTPLPMHLQNNNQPNSVVHKSGIAVQKVVATMEIPLPPQNTTTNTIASGQPTKIHAGESICVIRGRKGTYIRTSQGRIFAVRLNDTTRFTNAQSDTATSLSHSSSMSPSPSVLAPPSPTILPTPPMANNNNNASRNWIDLNQSKRIPMTSSDFYPNNVPPQNSSPPVFNHPMAQYPSSYRPPIPQYNRDMSQPPILHPPLPPNPYPNQGLYDPSPLNNLRDFAALSPGGSSSPVIGHSASYGSLNFSSSSNQIADTTTTNNIFSSNSYQTFPKSNSFTNGASVIGSSQSDPNLHDPLMEDSSPMDLSNPFPASTSSAQTNLASNFLPDDSSLDLNLPPFSW